MVNLLSDRPLYLRVRTWFRHLPQRLLWYVQEKRANSSDKLLVNTKPPSTTWNQKNLDTREFPEQTRDSNLSDNNREWPSNSAMYFALHINQLVLSRKQEYAEVDEHLKSNSVLDLKL
jgi:hypothetical protein